jgi:hypothetical protein
MKLVVVHDDEGEIVSLARVEPSGEDGPRGDVRAWPDRGYHVAELDVSPDLARLAPTDIAARFRVDRKARRLVEGGGGGEE